MERQNKSSYSRIVLSDRMATIPLNIYGMRRDDYSKTFTVFPQFSPPPERDFFPILAFHFFFAHHCIFLFQFHGISRACEKSRCPIFPIYAYFEIPSSNIGFLFFVYTLLVAQRPLPRAYNVYINTHAHILVSKQNGGIKAILNCFLHGVELEKPADINAIYFGTPVVVLTMFALYIIVPYVCVCVFLCVYAHFQIEESIDQSRLFSIRISPMLCWYIKRKDPVNYFPFKKGRKKQ